MSQPAPDDPARADARRRLLEKRLKGRNGPGVTSTTAADGRPPIPRRPTPTAPAPLSPAQERFWFLHRLAPDAPTYHMHEAWRAEGPLDVDRLERAVNAVIARHPALRTTIVPGPDGPMQQIHEHLPITVERLDVSNRSPGERATEVGRIATAEARALFDLGRGPLVRLAVVKESERCHTLLYTVHHIVSDERSNDLFWQHLAEHYRADDRDSDSDSDRDPDRDRDRDGAGSADDGEGEPPTGPSIDYADFAVWQRERAATGEHDAQLAHWRDRLSDLDEALRLPADHPAPTAPSGRGGLVQRPFDPALAPKVQALAAAVGATPFMVFLAAYQALLHRHSGQDDICVGTPIANRQRPEVADVIGLFLNTVVMRSRFEADTTFAQLLDSVRDRAVDAFANQDVPFDRLVDELLPDRDRSRHPLFQTMFVYSPAEALTRRLPGLTLTRLPVDGGVAKFDLTLFVTSDERSIEAGFEYDADRFEAATAERLLGHLERLLTAALADPDEPIAGLDHLTAAERAQLAAWSDPSPPSASTTGPESEAGAAHRGPLLHHLFEERVIATPRAVAVTAAAGPGADAAARSLTYAEVDHRAGRVAAALQDRGVGPGDLIGLLADRTPDAVVAMLGILKAGGAWVPIDPESPPARIAAIVADAGLGLIVTASPDHGPELPDGPATATVDQLAQRSDREPATPQIEPDSPAYVIYTSGSTGRPKGVVVTHANIVHSTRARFDFYHRRVERFLLLSSPAFDSSMVGLWWTLAQGGELVLPATGLHHDVRHLCDVIERHRVTHLLALPSLHQILLEEGAGRSGSLTTVVVAGEACPPNLVTAHRRRLPSTDLYNEYGPTEGTVWSHAWRCPDTYDGGTVPIGRPIPGTSGYVLDRTLEPVPIGVPGELVLGGPGVAAGYLNQPSLTAERFITIPELGDPDARYYRTGDLVRWRTDGEVEFLGRVDHQMKIRGHRIEPAEVEAAMVAHGGVASAAVVAEHVATRTGSGSSEAGGNAGSGAGVEARLIGYYVPLGEVDRVDETALAAHLRTVLPAPLVPSVLIALDDMPVTVTGKIDRSRLPRSPVGVGVGDGSGSPTEFVAPRDDLERLLADRWGRLLGIERVGVHDDFFALGGHSLLALRLFARIEEATGRKMLLSTLFEAPTVAQLADRIRADEPRPAPSSLVPIKSTGHKRPFFYVSPYTISVLEFRHLARSFDPDRPFYGVQPSGLDGHGEVHQTIPEMAVHYVQAMRSVQPDGPYLLGGHCDGGWVAYEMAVQLQEAGEEVGYLGLVDLPAPSIDDPYRNRWSRLIGRLRYYLDNRRFLNALVWKAKMQVQSRLARRLGAETSRRIEGVKQAHAQAFADFRFRYEFRGTVDFVLSSENLRIEQNMDWYRRWEDEHGQRVGYSVVDSTHDRLLYDPEARLLADAFGRGLDDAQARGGADAGADPARGPADVVEGAIGR